MYELQNLRALPLFIGEYLQQIVYFSYPIYFFSLSPITFFAFFVASVVVDYSNDRVEPWREEPSTFEQEKCVLAIAKNFLVLVMRLVVC